MGRLVETEEGYNFVSDNGVEYDLLEGTTIVENVKERTSDIVFVLLKEQFDENGDAIFNTNDLLVTWRYGAFMITDSGRTRSEITKDFEERTKEYEEKHPEVVKFYMDKDRKSLIKEILNEKIDEVYMKLQTKFGIENGDIDPLQLLHQEELVDKLTNLINKVLHYQKGDK